MNSIQNPQFDIAKAEIYLLIHRFIALKHNMFTYEQITNEIKEILQINRFAMYTDSFFVKDCIDETIMQLIYSRKLISHSSYYEPIKQKGKTRKIIGKSMGNRRRLAENSDSKKQ